MPGLPFNGKTVIGSKQAMILAEQPKNIIIIGAGAIGVEFAYFFNAFGTKVTVVEMLPHILPVEDKEVSSAWRKSLTKQGIRILTEHQGRQARNDQQGVQAHRFRRRRGSETIEAEVCLVAIGVSPLLPGGV